jgi:hypothetical protein
MMTTTPQGLGRTANVRDHVDLDSFCFHYLTRENSRYDSLAGLYVHLVRPRVAAVWDDVFDPRWSWRDPNSNDSDGQQPPTPAKLEIHSRRVGLERAATRLEQPSHLHP